MPYIRKTARAKYDEAIESLGFTLNSMHNNDKIAGELNYIFFRLVCTLCHEESGGARNYARMAVVSSALGEAQAEFRRRIMAPYEDQKIMSAGDVDL